MELPDRGQAKAWSGMEVLDLSGQSLGRCTGVFADTDTGVVEWLLIQLEGAGRSFVPAVDSVEDGGSVRLPFPRELVLSAPDVGDAEQLAKSDEMLLYRHYDVPFTDDASDSLLPDDVVVADAPEPLAVAEPEPEEPEVVVAEVAEVAEVAVAPVASADRPQVSALEAVTPVAATGAGVVALWVLLRALERRASRRRSPAVRSREAGRSALQATAGARQQAGRRLSAAAAAAAEVSRQAATQAGDSAAAASRTAQERQRTAAKAAAKRRKTAAKAAAKRRKTTAKAAAKRRKAAVQQRKNAAKTLGQQRKNAAKTLGQQRKSAAKAIGQQRKSAAKTIGQQRKDLTESRDQASKTLRRRRRQVSRTVSTATGSVAAHTSTLADAVTAAPSGVARKARAARRSITSSLWDALTVATAAGAYVLGARAGRERYAELTELARSLASAASERPEVQTAKQVVLDPEARAETVQAVREQGRQVLSQVSGGSEQREG